jgi:hypothetical protein
MLDTIERYTRKLVHLSANVYWEYKPIWTARSLYVSLEDIEIDRPIFIVGVQGAGLTLLSRMIHRNRSIVTIGGGRAFWTGNNEMDKHCVRELPDAWTLTSPGFQSPTFKNHAAESEREHEVFGFERCWVYATDEMVDRYRKTADDYTPSIASIAKRRIRESIRAYADDPQRARFLDMSQTFSLKLPLLLEVFPDAKIVVQTRNPYAMCWREATSGGYGYWKQKPPLKRRLELAAEHWGNTYRTLARDLQTTGAQHVVVRFEDLLERSEEELKRVTNVAEVAYHEDMVPRAHHTLPLGSGETFKWHPIRTNANEKYEKELTRDARSIIEDELGNIAGKFGYEN